MSQNWYQGQTGQYGQQQQQQSWGNQQQGWVQGGQWAGQPHPQQADFYGNQQQLQMGFQQGQPQQFPQQRFQAQSFGKHQSQSFGPQQGQQLSFSQQPGQPFGQQPGQQQLFGGPQQFGQPIPQQLPPGPQQQGGGGGGGQFLTQQAYAQEHERRVKEEKRKKEMEQQKKKLQNLKVTTKQSVNLDDLFEKQLPEVSRAPPFSVVQSTPPPQPPHTVSVSDGGDYGGVRQSVSGNTGDSENTIGTVDGTAATSENQTNTAETFQKLMAESLDITGSGKPKKVQFKPSAFKQQHSLRKETVQPLQSTKARSWDTEDFSGVFTQQQPEQSLQGGDNFGDFQSSEQQLSGGNTGFASFSATNEHSQVHLPEHSLNYSHPGSHVMQGGSHMTQPDSHMMQGVSYMTQPGSHMMQGGNHMIATSAYQGPLSSTNVLHGMQGQGPNSPQKQTTAHTVGAQTNHLEFHQTNNTLPQNSAGEPGDYSPQVPNFSPPGSSGSPAPPQSPPPSEADMSHFHPVYHKVYRLCRKQGEDNVSTDLLYPVLLSSKLSRVLLRDLWSRANKGKPGQLNQMELFVLLGLVALAQQGNNNPSLEDLKRTSSMPIPTLPALSTLSPPASTAVTHPLSSVNNNITAKDEFGHFHSSMNPSTLQQPILQATSTHTTLLPQPVSIPVQSTSISSPAPANPDLKPVEPVVGLIQPMTASSITNPATNNTTEYKYAAFGELQSMGLQTTPNIPISTNSTVNPSVVPITDDKYGALWSVNVAESTQLTSPTSPPSLPTSQVKDSYTVFDNLRQSESPAPDSLMTGGGQVQSLGSRTPLGNSQWIPQPLTSQPLLSSSQFLSSEPPTPSSTLSITSTVAINSQTQTSFILSPSEITTLTKQSIPPPPSPDIPIRDTSGSKSIHKQTEDDEFGDFAQFSSPLTFNTLQTTPSIISSTALSNTPFVSSSSSVGTADSLYVNSSGITGKPHPSLGVNEQGAGGDDGWADFGHFSSAPIQFTNTTSNLTEISANVTQQTLLGNNEQRPLFDQSPRSLTPVDSTSSKSQRFEFQRPGTPGSVPTIDDMEKELLSKLTPTLPRKQQQRPQQSIDSGSQIGGKPATSHSHKPVVGTFADEEGWRVCLMKCGEVLGACVDVLKDVDEKSLLQEIAQSEESHSKLHSIAEVYRFAKRLYATIHAKHITKAASEAEEVRKNWQDLNSLLPDNTMEKVYSSTQPLPPTNETVTDVLSDTISQCAICLMSKTVSIASSLSLDGHPEEYNISLLFRNGQTYHAPCANFWRHFVSEDVPVLG